MSRGGEREFAYGCMKWFWLFNFSDLFWNCDLFLNCRPHLLALLFVNSWLPGFARAPPSLPASLSLSPPPPPLSPPSRPPLPLSFLGPLIYCHSAKCLLPKPGFRYTRTARECSSSLPVLWKVESCRIRKCSLPTFYYRNVAKYSHVIHRSCR